MSYSEEQLWDLLQQAYDMPYGAAQIALVEQVIAHADALHDAELSFQARMRGTTSYVYGGEPAKSFVTFSWCLAEFDRDPARYARDQHTLLWHFKYMVSGLTKFPEVPLDRTYAVLDDMERRWRDGGHSMHAVYSYRHHLATHIGDLEAADDWFAKWCTAPRDDLSDCVGCDPSQKASFLSLRGRDEEGVALAEPVLSGRLTCSEQPQGILTNLLKPYLRTGRLEQARDAHRRAYRLHRPNLADLSDVADHIEFCALTGNEARGIEILQRHLGWLDRAPSPYATMAFAAAGALLLRRAREADHPPFVIPRPAFGGRAAGDVEPDALAAELAGLALDTAARFDARNGTDHQGRLVRATLDAVPIVEYLPLSPTAAHRSRRLAGDLPPAAGSAEGSAAASEAAGAALGKSAAAFGVSTSASTGPDAGAEALKRKVEAEAQAEVEAEIAAAAGPDDLLDLAEDHLRRGRRERAFALWHAFDERYALADLSPLQRGRRADGHGVETANADALPEAETAWRSAVELFAEARDEVRRQTTRGRLGRAMCATGRGEEGLAMVEEAASYLLAHATPDRWTGALVAVATAQLYVGRPDEALGSLERASEYLDSCLDPHARAHVAVQRAQCVGATGRMEDARAEATEAARISREVGYTEGIAHASMMVGFAAEQLGDAAEAVTAYDEAIAAASDAELIRRVRAQRAGLLAGSPRAAEVIDDLVEAVAERTAAGDDEGAARARHGLAIAYLNSGRPLDSAEVAEEALTWFAANADDPEGGDDERNHVLSVRHLLATAYQRLGQPEEAIAQLELISADCSERGNPGGVGQMAEEIGDILDRQDRDAAAALRYLAAAEAFHRAEQPIEEFRNRRQYATSLLWSDDVDGALNALAVVDEMSLRLPDVEHARWERAMVLFDGAKILRNADRAGEATLRAGSSAAAFRAIGFIVQAAHAEMLHAELLLRRDRPADAEEAARRGLAELPEGEEGRERLTDLLNAALEAQGRPPERA